MNYIFSLTINTAQDLTRKKNKRPSPLTSFQGLSVCPGNHGNQTVFWPQHLLPSCAPPPARRGGAWTPSGSSGRPPVAGDPRGLYWGSGTSHCCRNGPLTVPHGQLDHGQSLKDIEWKNGSVLSNRLTSFKQRCPHIVTFPRISYLLNEWKLHISICVCLILQLIIYRIVIFFLLINCPKYIISNFKTNKKSDVVAYKKNCYK